MNMTVRNSILLAKTKSENVFEYLRKYALAPGRVLARGARHILP